MGGSVVSDIGKQSHAVRAGGEVVSAVQFSKSLTAAIDTWAEAHHISRGDAIRVLVELGLRLAPVADSYRSVRHYSGEIEGQAVSRISALLDPSLPSEERERRIRRLIEGPPEFVEQRIDLPKHLK
jgi:hypothetical protein